MRQQETASFEPTPESVRSARSFVREVLHAWRIDGGMATLLTSEVVTNAVLHAGTDVTVDVARDDDCVRIEVFDGSPRMPMPVLVSRDATSGRGLSIVDALSNSWGMESRPGGKVVWFEFPAAVALVPDERPLPV
jgi:anti-sigma regulatory factor (Ser/Thr protein kinase)